MKERTIETMVLPADAVAIDLYKKYLGVNADEAVRIIYLMGVQTLADLTLTDMLALRYSTAQHSMDGQMEANEARSEYRYDGDIEGILNKLYTFDESYTTYLEAIHAS